MTWKDSLALTLLVALGCLGCKPKSTSDDFHQGRDLLVKGQFDQAEAELAAFEKAHPGHKLGSRARFLLAKAKMGAGDLAKARVLFEETIAQFPNSEEAAKSRYKLAVLDFLEGDKASAERRFQAIVDRSNSILVAEATAMLKMLQQEQDD